MPVSHTGSHRGVRFVLLLVGALLFAVAGAQPDHAANSAHQHEIFNFRLSDDVLCVAPESVVIDLQGFVSERLERSQTVLVNSLHSSLNRAFRQASVSTATSSLTGSCANSDSFVTIAVQVRALDPAIYRSYGSDGFSYSLWVQVGAYAEASDLQRSNFLLPDTKFVAFQEDAFSETRRGVPVEMTVLQGANELLDELAAAWRSDNP
jgi:hypothetical protein